MRNVSASRPWPVRATCCVTAREQAAMTSAASDGDMCSRTGGVATPSDASCATSRSALSPSGFSWTRYSDGTPRSDGSRATCSLAAIMRCSISRCDSVCSLGRDSATWPPRSKRNSGSLVSSSSASWLMRRSCSAAATARAASSGAAHGSSAGSSPGEDAVDLLVVQPRVRADRRAVEAHPRDVGPREVELDGHRRALLQRHERAGLVGQRLGQHRLHAPGDVDARPAPRRLAVDERARPHVGADVGDVHPDPGGAVVEALGGDRVVEVARGDRIDRERRQVGEVAAGDLLVDAVVARLLGGALHGGIEAPPQPAVEHERLEHVGGHVRAPEAAQDLGVAAGARGRPDQHEVADRDARVAVEDHAAARREERLGDEKAPALVDRRDDPLGGPRLTRGAARPAARRRRAPVPRVRPVVPGPAARRAAVGRRAWACAARGRSGAIFGLGRPSPRASS